MRTLALKSSDIKLSEAIFPAPAGTSRRNILREPHTRELDFSVFKNFQLGHNEARKLPFRTDVFNLLNTPLFNNPNATIGSPPPQVQLHLLEPSYLSEDSGEIQLALKLIF